ncbi:MAG: hypothetical protein Q8N21_04055 [bacterium]|nr:hypothetical protein [bacterium]
MFYIITKELFYTLTAALIIFCALELAWPGVVLAYININWVLIFWLIVSIIVLAADRVNNNYD